VADSTVPFGAFGTTRGSGLARGKRTTPSAAPAAAAATGAYQPTAIEVVTHQREYQNPFAPATPAPAAEPTPVAAEVKPEPAPVPVAPPVAVAPVPQPVVAPPPAAPAAVPEEKATLNILPPEDNRPAAQNWDSGSFRQERSEPRGDLRPRREERGSFRPERRDEPRLEPRAPRPDQPKLEQRAPLPKPAEKPKSSGGFIGWLKGFFGGKSEPKASPATPSAPGRGEPFAGGDRRDRQGHYRQRGGQGYRGEPRSQGGPAPREGGQSGGGSYGGEGQQGYDGQRRRRRRGGRGRHHGGGGGDDRGGPRGDYRGGPGGGPGPQGG
jgi:translation initiation factor IF-2